MTIETGPDKEDKRNDGFFFRNDIAENFEKKGRIDEEFNKTIYNFVKSFDSFKPGLTSRFVEIHDGLKRLKITNSDSKLWEMAFENVFDSDDMKNYIKSKNISPVLIKFYKEMFESIKEYTEKEGKLDELGAKLMMCSIVSNDTNYSSLGNRTFTPGNLGNYDI